MPIDFSTVVGPWTAVPGSFPAGFSFMNHAATLLNNGKVLIAGGSGSPAGTSAGRGSGTTATQLYDPATDTWTVTGSLSVARTGDPTATLLKDGKVLLVGAGSQSAQPPARPGMPPALNVQTAELYDPGAGTWSQTANMNAIRTEQTATLLNDGRVLVVGGIQSAAGTTAEIYDPIAKTWTPTGSLSVARGNHTATLLPNGKVLVAGGTGDAAGTTAELYDPGAGTWSMTGNLNVARASHTATILNNGTVLVAGGEGSPAASPPIGASPNPGDTAEIYNPGTGTWTRTAFGLSTTHVHHTATLLPNGNVLVAGGGILNKETAVAELYLTKSNRWVSASSMTVPRGNHTATLLMDNRVLVVGGTGQTPGYLSLDFAAGFTDECYFDAGAEIGRMLQTVRWGYVRPDGTLQAGSGNFTVNKAATGVYDILFTPPFTSIPLVQATQIYNQNVTYVGGDTRDNTVIVGITAQRCRMKTGDSNGLPSDRAFSFMAHAINAVPVPLRPVTLAQVSVANATNAIGVDAANNVYQFISSDGANWMQIPITNKQMKLVSMASDSTVCGLDSNGAIWQYSITNNAWTPMAAGPVAFFSVSCGSATNIWAVGTDYYCYQNTGSGWTKMGILPSPAGAGKQVSVASDGTMVTNDANGLLYQYNATSSNWQVMDAGWGFSQFSCGSATNISGVDMGGTFWKFTAGPGAGRTQVVPGSTGKQISVASDGTAWSIGTDNLVYRLVSNAWTPLLV